MDTVFNALSIGDHPEVLAALEKNLSADEFIIESVENTDQLKESLNEEKPDLVFLNTDNTDFNPFKICKKFAIDGVAVIMISGVPTRPLIINSVKHGAIDFFVKPLRVQDIAPRSEKALIKTGKKDVQIETELRVDFGQAKDPQEKVDMLIKNVDEVLALPFAVVKIIKLCNDPSASTKDLVKPVNSDPAVAAMIMRRATSAAFAGVDPNPDLQRAIVRIGLRATRNIAASFSVFKLFSKDQKNLGFNRLWFWAHSLATGVCAQFLASLLKHKQPEDAFIAGLLHDIGKMVLDDFLNEDYHKALQKANTEELPIRMGEKAVFGAHHAAIGSKIVKFWGFPPAIVQAIARHHRYERLINSDDNNSLGAIVCMANHMAKALNIGSGGDYLMERDARPLWNRLPKDIPWQDIVGKVFEELSEYTDILEVPVEQFKLELPEENKGKAGLYQQNSQNFGNLIQIALETMGLTTLLFKSLDDESIKKEELDVIIGDLTSLDNEDEMDGTHKKLSSLAKKCIVLPPTDEKKRPFNLDFFWLESSVNEAFETK